MAVPVDDASAAPDRAVKLLAKPFRQAVGPGELDIPAVRGLGGSLLYFVDSKTKLGQLWDVDFDRVESAGDPDAGLLRFDHLSQSMQYEEMLTWLLFYTSLLDMKKTPVQDVIDPGGGVQSPAVEPASRAVPLVLHASPSPRP